MLLSLFRPGVAEYRGSLSWLSALPAARFPPAGLAKGKAIEVPTVRSLIRRSPVSQRVNPRKPGGGLFRCAGVELLATSTIGGVMLLELLLSENVLCRGDTVLGDTGRIATMEAEPEGAGNTGGTDTDGSHASSCTAGTAPAQGPNGSSATILLRLGGGGAGD